MNEVLVFDIETLALKADYQDLNDKYQALWEQRCERKYSNEYSKIEGSNDYASVYQALWERYSALHPEYSEILCLSLSVPYNGEVKYKTLIGDEKDILTKFFQYIYKFMNDGTVRYLAGHNIKNFDIPYIIKRAMINGISYRDLPVQFQILGKKPWDLDYILDTKEMWSFGSYMMAASLDEACVVLDVDSPKDGQVSGEHIYDFVYKKGGDKQLIYDYCKRDVAATKSLLDKFYSE